MFIPLRLLLFSTVITASLHAATLTADYRFQGDLNDSLPGGVALTSGGGTVGATTYDFAANQFLSVSGILANNGDYSIGMRFSFDTTTGYRKFVDFQNRASDCGQYVNGNTNFFCGGSGGPNVAAGVMNDFLLTRNGATNQYTAYLNGSQVLSFTDGGNSAVFNPGIMYFFTDDGIQTTEASAGSVDRIMIWDGALSSTQVGSISLADEPIDNGGAVPEPSTVVLVSAAGAALALRRRRALS